MTILQSIILGLVEGFTEFLPISSTAHLILTSKLLQLETSEFLKTFEIAIQLGTITAVGILYRNIFLKNWEANKKIVVAFLPTAIIGLAFYKIVKNVFLANPAISIWALLIGGVVIIIFEKFHHDDKATILDISGISYSKSFLIGLAQSVSIIPGVSRAAATIIGGLAMGIDRKTIVEFSFLLAVPTMIAATGLDLLKSYQSFSGADFLTLGAGFIVSFATAMVSISWLLKYIKKNNFTYFGIYRMIIALTFLFFI